MSGLERVLKIKRNPCFCETMKGKLFLKKEEFSKMKIVVRIMKDSYAIVVNCNEFNLAINLCNSIMLFFFKFFILYKLFIRNETSFLGI